MPKRSIPRPTHSQLMLPLLETIEKMGGRARPKEVYDAVAERLGVEPAIRRETIKTGGQTVNVFERHIRWARQTAIIKGLIDAPERGIWRITTKGEHALGNARPGIVVTVFETEKGKALWALAEDAAGLIAKSSVDLIFSSPPYPLIQPKQYGTLGSADWLDWMTGLAARWHGILKPSGSLMVNLGAVWQPGQPVLDPYIERYWTSEMIPGFGLVIHAPRTDDHYGIWRYDIHQLRHPSKSSRQPPRGRQHRNPMEPPYAD